MDFTILSDLRLVATEFSGRLKTYELTDKSCQFFGDVQRLERNLMTGDDMFADLGDANMQQQIVSAYESVFCDSLRSLSRIASYVMGYDNQELASIEVSDLTYPLVNLPDDMKNSLQEIIVAAENCQKSLSANCPSPTVKETEILGRDYDKHVLIDRLLSETSSSNISVTAIVGHAGVGKTTLARVVYNDIKVSDYFDYKMWFYVTKGIEIKHAMKTMLELITGESSSCDELDLLKIALEEKLKQKKLLLVLDNFWDDTVQLYELLKESISKAEKAKTVITARYYSSVARALEGVVPFYLGSLDEDASHKLFQSYALRRRNLKEQQCVLNVSKALVKSIGGNPMMLKYLGRYLESEANIEKWVDILFRSLPDSLKPCYWFCGFFPKGYEFTKAKLVRLWISLGYIEQFAPESIYSEGISYFDILHRQSCFYISDIKDEVEMNFKVPDDIIDYFSGKAHVEACQGKERFRHLDDRLYVNNVKETSDLLSSQQFYNTTTLFLHDLQLDTFPTFILNFQGLRNLDFISHSIKEISESICSLIFLHYLSITSGSIERLSESVCSLCNLMVFELSGCLKLKQLPKSIGSLVNLQILAINGCKNIKEFPISMRELCNLVHLQLTNLNLTQLPEFVFYLKNLETLDLLGCAKLKELPKGITNLINLQTLYLTGCRSLKELPDTLAELPKLQQLHLGKFHMRWMPAVIAKLTNLNNLHYHYKRTTNLDSLDSCGTH